jgi:hypothetical protein
VVLCVDELLFVVKAEDMLCDVRETVMVMVCMGIVIDTEVMTKTISGESWAILGFYQY